ncbi:unnamed protein product [Cylicocyclus nassatus]|uniref:Uncharacterized protein n=1 Tax=Cylicocyclus nassatus TaxID=53992 RepID=A0AA36MHG1_CYLNA|nr:unnamed protein product [Cylicocyclus nassatus]
MSLVEKIDDSLRREQTAHSRLCGRPATSTNMLLLFLVLVQCFCQCFCESLALSCGVCPRGTMCDSNTGICRPFRIIDNVDAQIPCGTCTMGTMCDSNTGICRPFRIPGTTPSPNLCNEVVCPVGYQCDDNNGICRKFREGRRK